MKRLYVFLGIILALTILLYFTLFRSTYGGLPDFNYPREKVSKIFMVDKLGKSIKLEKKNDREWTLNDSFPANEEMVNRILDDINDQKAISTVSSAMASTVKESMEQYYTKVEVYNDEELVLQYYVGIADPSNRGNYMYMDGHNQIYDVQLEKDMRNMTYDYVVNAYDWRSIWILDYKEDQIKEVTLQYMDTPSTSFDLLNTPPKYELTGNPPLETALIYPKVENYLRFFERVPVMEIVDENVDKEHQMRPSNKLCQLDLKLKNGAEKRVEVFYFPYTESSKNPLNGQDPNEAVDVDYLYAYTPDDDQMYVVQWLTFGKILRRYKEFYER